MTIDQLHVEILKVAGGLIALVVLFWFRIILLGKRG